MALRPTEADCIGSIASAGSIASIASAGSIVAIGSAGSIRGRYAMLAGLVTIGVAVRLSRA